MVILYLLLLFVIIYIMQVYIEEDIYDLKHELD